MNAPGSSVFSNTLNALNERGEKLTALEEKFGKLNSASKNFADALKEHNEKEAKKKWWQI